MNLEPGHLWSSFENLIWGNAPEAMPGWRGHLLRVVRFIAVLIRDVLGGQLTLRAMGLVYTSLLSLVPLLALSFSVLKAFGVHNQLQPALHRFLAPLGMKGDEIGESIVHFIDNMNVGVLGSVGLALLLYTAVSLMQKIEEAFNFIWHVTQPRSLGERFSSYLSVLLVGPILLFAALGLTATAMNIELVQKLLAIEPFGRAAYELGKLTPYVLVIVAFTLIYLFIPNTRVYVGPAVLGGVVGGVMWQSAGWAFALFAASSTQYSAIYSSFAILILFLIWLHLSWLILLFGASVAFYRQHPEYIVADAGEPLLSNRMRERLALVIMSRIAERHLAGNPPWTLQQLTQALNIPMHAVQLVLDSLEAARLVACSNDDPPGYLPERDLGAISVKELLDTVRAAGEDRFLNPAGLRGSSQVDQAMQRFDEALSAALTGLSVRDLASAPDPARPEERKTGA